MGLAFWIDGEMMRQYELGADINVAVDECTLSLSHAVCDNSKTMLRSIREDIYGLRDYAIALGDGRVFNVDSSSYMIAVDSGVPSECLVFKGEF